MKKYTIDDLEKEFEEFIPKQPESHQNDNWFLLNKIVELTNMIIELKGAKNGR